LYEWDLSSVDPDFSRRPGWPCAEQAGRGVRGAAPDGAAAGDAAQPDDSLHAADIEPAQRIPYEGNGSGRPLSRKAVPLNHQTFGRGAGPRAPDHAVVPRAVPASRREARLRAPRPARSAHRQRSHRYCWTCAAVNRSGMHSSTRALTPKD